MNITEAVLNNVLWLLPWRIVHEYEQGVRWTFGRAAEPRGAGWLWFCPVVQSVEIVDCTEWAVDLGKQTLGKVTIHSEMRFKVSDARKCLLHVGDDDVAENVKVLGRAAVSDFVAKYQGQATWPCIFAKIRVRVRRELDERGIDLLDYSATEQCQTLNVRLLNESHQPEC